MVTYDLLLFMLKIEITTLGTNYMPFFAFQRDHLRSTSGIVCGSGSFAVGDHLRRCTAPCLFINRQTERQTDNLCLAR